MIDMEKLVFLLVVAVAALVLVGFILRLERKHRAKAKALQNHAQQKAQLHHRYHTGTYHHIHGHVADARPHGEVWASRHKRAGDEDRGHVITANRLYSDVELADDKLESGLSMTSIEYTPEELNKRSTPNRR